MLVSCKYCGRIHDSKKWCPQKLEAIKSRQKNRKLKYIDTFRSSNTWRKKSIEIKERDKYCCQICIRKLYNPLRQFETENLEVHHILPLLLYFDKRLDNDILITLCRYHHELAENGVIPIEELIDIIKEQNNDA